MSTSLDTIGALVEAAIIVAVRRAAHDVSRATANARIAHLPTPFSFAVRWAAAHIRAGALS